MSGILRLYRVNITSRPLDFFLERDPQSLQFDLDQPYQRGVVWGTTRKRNLIKSILMGVPVPAIVINNRFDSKFDHPGYSQDRNWSYAIVDGKQRVTALRQFAAGKFSIPQAWVDDEPGDLYYPDAPITFQRRFKNTALPVAEGHFGTLAQEQELFDLINFGGLAQGETDDDTTE